MLKIIIRVAVVLLLGMAAGLALLRLLRDDKVSQALLQNSKCLSIIAPKKYIKGVTKFEKRIGIAVSALYNSLKDSSK